MLNTQPKVASIRLIKRVLLASFFIRFTGSLVRAFGELVQPHVWRQIDTLGVSYRYFLRFFFEHPSSSGNFFPALLQSGDGNGIAPMEFPFLNFIFSPFWALGPYWGKVSIYLTLACLVYALVWKLYRTRFWFALAFLLLPTVSYSADYIEKFMPDALSVLLVTLGVTYAIRNRKLCAFILVALGILVKPPAIVALSLLFFTPSFRKQFQQHVPWIAASVGVALLYYTLGLKWIDHARMGSESIFYVAPRNPLTSLLAVLSNPRFIADQFENRLIFVHGFILTLLGCAWIRSKKELLVLAQILGVFILQFCTVAALDGAHMAQHDYYCLGIAPLAALFLFRVIRRTHRYYAYILLAYLFIHSIELSAQNLNTAKLTGFYRSRQECQELIQKHPEMPWKNGFVFRSDVEPFPSLGLCFGEREGSQKSEYGFFYRSGISSLPSQCKVMDQTETFALAKCSVDKYLKL